MKIINQTLLNYKVLDETLILRVVHTNQNELDLESMHYLPYELPDLQERKVVIHDVYEEETRFARLRYKGQEHKATNPQTFWSFAKKHLKGEKSKPESIVYFDLSDYIIGEELIYKSSTGKETSLMMRAFYWKLFSLVDLEQIEIQPELLRLDFYPKSKRVDSYVGYPLFPIDQEQLFLLHPKNECQCP